ncbi:hypothetical protein GCM10018966_041690 [Streptomyces yanii]
MLGWMVRAQAFDGRWISCGQDSRQAQHDAHCTFHQHTSRPRECRARDARGQARASRGRRSQAATSSRPKHEFHVPISRLDGRRTVRQLTFGGAVVGIMAEEPADPRVSDPLSVQGPW